MVYDWRELNWITIKNQACLPNIDDLFDAIQGSAYIIKIDLRSRYHQIRIADTDVPKTAINTPFGHYECPITEFGLANAPVTFQSLMNSTLRPYLRKFVVVFLDDIHVLSKTWTRHTAGKHVVLQALQVQVWVCCREILFLDHVLTGHTIAPDPKKVQSIRVWPPPPSTKEIRQFLGLTNYFRWFIDHYVSISRLLSRWGDNRKECSFPVSWCLPISLRITEGGITTATLCREVDRSCD